MVHYLSCSQFRIKNWFEKRYKIKEIKRKFFKSHCRFDVKLKFMFLKQFSFMFLTFLCIIAKSISIKICSTTFLSYSQCFIWINHIDNNWLCIGINTTPQKNYNRLQIYSKASLAGQKLKDIPNKYRNIRQKHTVFCLFIYE